MVLAVRISPEELLEDFNNTALTQNQNVCITNLSRIYEYYIDIKHIISENKWQDSADGNDGHIKIFIIRTC